MKNSAAVFPAGRPYGDCSSRLSVSSRLGAVAALIIFTAAVLSAQAKPKEPSVNAGAGSCSASFLVQGHHKKPIYAATIKLRFHYGLFGLHKASLEAFTDVNGRVRFEGLPRQPKSGAYVFQISHGNYQKSITDDPMETCQAKYTVALP